MKTDGHVAAYTGGTATDSGSLVEADETNNTQALPITLSRPDLSVSNASIGAVVSNQNGSFTIPVTFTVTNNGAMAAQPYWYDMAYLSTDGVLDNADQGIYGPYRSTALAPGASYTTTISYTTTTSTAQGAYTLFMKTDGHVAAYTGGTATDSGSLVEADETNNTQALPLTLSRPDLSVSNASIGAIISNQNGSFTIPVTFTVTNNGAVAAQPVWYDMAYLSTDGVLDNADQGIYGNYRNTALAPGASYTATINYTTTMSTAQGAYTLFMKTDGNVTAQTGGTATDSGRLVEADETNNTQALAVTLP
jgi:hypothetical protein